MKMSSCGVNEEERQALDVLPKVVGIMAEELHWSAKRQRQEIVDTEKFMESMGVPLGSRPSLTDQPTLGVKWAWDNWACPLT